MPLNRQVFGSAAFAAVVLASGSASAASDPTGVWVNDTGRGAIEIKQCGDGLCGHVVWVKDPADTKGCGRQIIGEIRGSEAWQMVLLMESGAGSISTTHAANAKATMRKLVTCAMQAGPQVSMELAAAKLADAVDIVVHLNCDILPAAGGKLARKHRYVSEILEVTPGERPQGFATNTIFAPVPGRCAVAHTRPDSLWDDLIAKGFNALGFERELGENRRQA